MRLSNKNIGIYIWVWIFLQPNLLNYLHFALVSHDHVWNFEKVEKDKFQQKDKFHNCEQYTFKVPPTTELNLAFEIQVEFISNFENLIEKESKILIQNKNYTYPKRGPPDLIYI